MSRPRRARTRAEKLALRDKAWIDLMMAGFTEREIADAWRMTAMNVRRRIKAIEAMRGGPIEPVPELVAKGDQARVLSGLPPRLPELLNPPDDRSARERIADVLRERPDVLPDELADAAGVSASSVYRHLGPSRSHAESRAAREARRPAILAALGDRREGEAFYRLAERYRLPADELLAVARSMGLTPGARAARRRREALGLRPK